MSESVKKLGAAMYDKREDRADGTGTTEVIPVPTLIAENVSSGRNENEVCAGGNGRIPAGCVRISNRFDIFVHSHLIRMPMRK